MAELPLNNCALPHSMPPTDPFGAPLALTYQDCEFARSQRDHHLYTQVSRWPIAHLLEYLPYRSEVEWNDDLTSSGDLIFIGAVPKELTNIITRYCRDALVRNDRILDRARIKNISTSLKNKWRDILSFLRIKLQAIQQVISAQLGAHKKELLCKQQETLEKEADTRDLATEPSLVTTVPERTKDNWASPSATNLNGQYIIRTCMGKGCYLSKHLKQFRISRHATNAKEKKCPQRRIF